MNYEKNKIRFWKTKYFWGTKENVWIFEKVNSHAEVKNNTLDFGDKENFIKAIGDFVEILLQIENRLDEFVMIEIHPYLID